MLELTDETFSTTIYKDTVAVVDFYSHTCAPCKKMEPLMLEWEKEYNSVLFSKVDAINNSLLKNEYQITSVPTFIVFKGGKEKARHIGLLTKERLEEMLFLD